MKRLLTSAAMFLCCVATSFAQFSGLGAGTENDPYLIMNPIQLNQLRNFLNTEGVYFKLMANIDLTEFLEEESPTQGWQPVGTSSTPFKGVLDGNGKTISGFWIDRSNTNYVGLFGNLSGGTVKNLSLNGSFVKGKDYVGFLSGIGGNIDNCSFIGSVSGISYVGGCTGSDGFFTTIYSSIDVDGSGDYVGGVSGQNGTFQDCKVSNTLIRGNNYVGGVCGANKMEGNTIYNCIIETTIIATNCVGGISGEIVSTSGPYGGEKIEIRNCGFVGNVSATSMVGGIVGRYKNANWATQKILENNYAIGTLSATGDCVGGIVGYTEPAWSNPYASGVNIRSSYFSGNVSGNQNVGGLVGQLYSGSIKSSYSASSIVGNNNVGGICGSIKGYSSQAYAVLESNFAIALSIKANEGDVGRIYGKKDKYVYIGEMGTSKDNKVLNRCIVIEAGVAKDIIDNEQNGTGISNTTLKLKATYVAVGWDFTNTWEIQETECYPYMKSQTAPPVILSQVISGATTISGKCVDGGTVTLEIDGVKQQMVSSNHEFSFTVSPLQAGHEVRVSAKADGKEQSYFTTEVVSFLGKGTEADPYQISTAADLTQVYRKGYYKLMNDIDLTDYINQFSPTEGWQSIGRDGSETIHFDGDGHKVTGLWCNTTRDNTGLFSCFANGNIKNLTVETASGKQVKGGANTGILIGKMINGTIENCHVSGTVADGTPVGGIVGLLDGGSISQSQANVTISTTGATSYVGGIVGEITSGTVDQCVTTGTLTATGSESYVGGIIGKNRATVTNCYSTAKVTSSYNAAGIVAYNYCVVDMCYATGDLYSNNYAAGVIGYNDGTNAVISNCAAMNNKIEIVYESQQVQQGGGYGQRIIGGIKNNAPAPEMNNYALKTMQVSLNDVPQKVYDDIMNGTAKTNAELKQKATYQELDWDFDNVWHIDEDESYPYQTVKVDDGSDPEDPNNPDNPDPQGEVEVTDISTISNVIYIESMEEMCGTQATISLKMKNTAAIRGFQFDLYLPEGVTVVKSSKGKIQGFLSEDRLPDEDEHTLTFSEQPDGAIRFLCSSQYDETFTGNDGEIATLRVNITEEMTDGDYLLQLKNIKLTETDISKYYETPLVKCKLTIKTYTLGDINSDGMVDVSDYTGVANHIHGNTPDGFVVKAGDVDESGTIDVSDYTGIANIIHTGSIYGSNAARAMSRNTKKVNTDISSMSNIVYIDPFDVSAGEQTTLSIKMKNSAAIRGFQFDLYLPEGITAAKSNKGRIIGSLSAGRLPDEDGHELTFSEQQDGAIRFLCSSQYDETFTGTDGEIATLTISIDAGVAVGDYPVYLRNMKLTETDISKFYTTDEVETTVTVTGAADGRVVLDETSTTAPENANGVNVRVKRTINAGEWSTICLPFAMTAAQCQAAFGSDVEIGDFTGYTYDSDEDKITVNFSSVTAIAANHPYIIKVSAAVTEFTVDGVDVNPADNPRVTFRTSSKKLKDFVGTYVADFDFYDDAKHTPLFLSGNKFWYATESTKHMKAFRAYFDFVDMLSEVDAARVAIAFDEATVINDVRTCSDDRYYNLSGQQVETPTKGVYVKNGKKIIVK